MAILNQEIKTRFNYTLSVDFKERLVYLSATLGKDINEMITESLKKNYPQLQTTKSTTAAHVITEKP